MKQCTNVTGYKKDLHNNIYFLINQHKYTHQAGSKFLIKGVLH